MFTDIKRLSILTPVNQSESDSCLYFMSCTLNFDGGVMLLITFRSKLCLSR